MAAFLSIYRRTPLYVRILIGLLLGVGVGLLMGKDAQSLKPVSDLVLQLLRLLATPLIFIALIHSLLKSNVSGKKAGKLLWLLMSNTVVAIIVGLLVANVIRPGSYIRLEPPGGAPDKKPYDIGADLISRVPADFFTPFT